MIFTCLKQFFDTGFLELESKGLAERSGDIKILFEVKFSTTEFDELTAKEKSSKHRENNRVR